MLVTVVVCLTYVQIIIPLSDEDMILFLMVSSNFLEPDFKILQRSKMTWATSKKYLYQNKWNSL